MKRINNLYDKIISIENLNKADINARKGKLKTYGVRLHDKYKEENILKLHEQLKNKEFKTSPYEIFTIYEPKERIIYRLPYYPDRIVHHAIMNILESIWVNIFTHNTFSCIKCRGIEGCARYIEKIIKKYREKPLYCLKIDIVKYYPSINHDILKQIIRKKIKDKDLLYLLDEIIDSAPGVPIGNYLSQYFANLYLCYFMHYANETLKLDCAEYADDIVFFSSSKEELRKNFISIKNYLENKLKLKVKKNYQIFPIANNVYDKRGRALDYIGYKFYRNQKLIRNRIKKNFCRKVHKINKYNNLNLKQYKQVISPWLGWIKHSDSRNLLKTLVKPNYYDSILR